MTVDEPPTCVKCGQPVTRDWAGWAHAAGYRGKRHVVKVSADATTAPPEHR